MIPIRTIKISKEYLNQFGSYQQYIILSGHKEGNLSGANLRGEAKTWSGKYKKSRGKVFKKLEKDFKVYPEYELNENHRWVVVWKQFGDLISFEIKEEDDN